MFDSICRGNMWVKLGLVQSLLLSPVGPVDPVEKTRIELEHVNEEVSILYNRSPYHVRNMQSLGCYCRDRSIK